MREEMEKNIRNGNEEKIHRGREMSTKKKG